MDYNHGLNMVRHDVNHAALMRNTLMTKWVIIGSLMLSTLLGLITLAWTILRLKKSEVIGRDWLGFSMIAVAVMADLVAFIMGILLTERETPLAIIHSHVDGLLLITILLSMLVLYIKLSRRLVGLDLFALSAMSFFGLWGVCSGWFTFRPFEFSPLLVFHLLTVYLGAVTVTVAAAAGGCYLWVQSSLKNRKDPVNRMKRVSRFANLESVERVMTLASATSFCCLALSFVTGLFLLGAAKSPEALEYVKIGLTFVIWVMFAAIMHVRLAPSLRGRRAAMLSIAGFVLILVTMSVAVIQAAMKYRSQPEASAVNAAASFEQEGRHWRASDVPGHIASQCRDTIT